MSTNFDDSQSPYERPAYRAAEAAHILALPAATVSAWCFGQSYHVAGDDRPRRFRAVIDPADHRRKLLSFTNLCELHLLGAIRRRHRVTLPQVRKAIGFMRSQLGDTRPLISRHFRTNGVDLFVEHADKLLNVSQSGQQALRQDFEQALDRIEFGARHGPVLLFPPTRDVGAGIAQPKTVLVDPLRSFGRPVLAGVYVRTEVMLDRFRAGDSIAEMAQDYGARPEDIEEALRFEERLAA